MPTGFDPHLSGTGADVYLFAMIFDGLVRYKPGTMDTTEFEPGLHQSQRH